MNVHSSVFLSSFSTNQPNKNRYYKKAHTLAGTFAFSLDSIPFFLIYFPLFFCHFSLIIIFFFVVLQIEMWYHERKSTLKYAPIRDICNKLIQDVILMGNSIRERDSLSTSA